MDDKTFHKTFRLGQIFLFVNENLDAFIAEQKRLLGSRQVLGPEEIKEVRQMKREISAKVRVVQEMNGWQEELGNVFKEAEEKERKIVGEKNE